jgi:cytoskeletal protein RodZ
MAETVGKKLCKARLAKGLTIDEAAHATKMRPDKILALENDDYSRFANNTYAKGFLVIYGRFLNIDVAAQVRTLEGPARLNVEDYQYLNRSPDPEPERLPRYSHQRRAPSIMPLVILLGMLAFGGFGLYLYVNAKRLGSLDQLSRRQPGDLAVDTTPTPAVPASNGTSPTPSIEAVANPPIASAGAAPALEATPTAAPATPPNVPVPPQAAPPGAVHEVTIASTKRTYIRVHRDSRESDPIFEDYLYPDAKPLKLRGPRFFIEAREPGGIEIRKNGAPIAYQAPGITVQ